MRYIFGEENCPRCEIAKREMMEGDIYLDAEMLTTPSKDGDAPVGIPVLVEARMILFEQDMALPVIVEAVG